MNHSLMQETASAAGFIARLQQADSIPFYQVSPAPAEAPVPRGSYSVDFTPELSARLMELCKGRDINIYKLAMAAVYLLMAKYTLRSQLLLTSTSVALNELAKPAPRPVFFLVNTDGSQTVKQLLAAIHEELEQVLSLQDYPPEQLTEALEANAALAATAYSTGFWYRQVNTWHDSMDQVGMLFRLYRDGGSLRLQVDYDAQIYTPEATVLLADHLQQTLEVMSAGLSVTAGSLSFLTRRDQEMVFQQFNNTQRSYDATPVVTQFEKQAALTPDAIAVKSGGCTLTYAQLDRRANQLAHRLLNEFKLRKQEKVSLMVNRSERIITGILAILKAGGVYIPIDLSSPKDRVRFFLEDSESRVVLTEKELLCNADENGAVQWVDMDDCGAWPEHRPDVKQLEQDLAYMIYTSGTTGKPKGSMIWHYSLANHVSWFRRQFELTPADSTMLINSYSFDGCYSYIWATLTCGATLHVPRDSFFDPDQTLRYIRQEQITFLKMVPSTFGVLVNSATFEEDPGACRSVRVIKQGGETINVKNLRRYFEKYPNAILGNHYGATECTIGSVAYWITSETIDAFARQPVVGRPFDNQYIYILDKDAALLPVGVPGEICIGGAGVGNGYLKREELTARKFIDNPFRPGEKLYRTGDQGRWLPDGRLEFSGRIDNQVKIRGYRVELDEISETLKAHPQVTDALVLVHQKDGQDQLAAFIKTGETVDGAGLLQFAKDRLPDYMVPLYFVPVNRIPLTPNGKINKAALPNPETHKLEIKAGFVPPSNPVEEQLVQIWQELLDIPAVGIHDNFFDAGGNSLTAARLTAGIHRQFNIRLPLKEIFLHPTIEAQASLLLAAGVQPLQQQFTAIEQIPEAPHYALSHAQKRMWVLAQLQENQVAYNIPHAVRLRGPLHIPHFEMALQALAARHESLRTVFMVVSNEPRQRIIAANEFNLKLVADDLRGTGDAETRAAELAAAEAATVFDLEQGPLIKVRLLQLADEEFIFIYTLHHIISDGWSNMVLNADLLNLYASLHQGDPAPAPLPLQYKDFAAWHNLQMESAAIEPHRQYWLEQFSGELPVLELPADFTRPAVKTFKGAYKYCYLPAGLHQRLTRLSAAGNTSLFMVLLSAVKALLYRYTGQNDLVVGTPVAGREHADLAGQVGFYVNTAAIRSEVKGDAPFTTLLEQVKHRLLDAFEHQVYPFDRLIEDLDLPRNTGRTPLFDVMVVMQNNGTVNDSLVERNQLQALPYDNEMAISKFDLTVDFKEEKEGLMIGVEYSTDLFEHQRMDRLLEHLGNLLAAVADNAATTVDELAYLSPAEQQLVTTAFTGTSLPVPAHVTVQQLFEAQAALNPGALAVSDDSCRLTYAALSSQSDRLAAHILAVHPPVADEVIGIVMQRNAGFVTAMLAVLKSGGAYMPVEAQTPPERIALMLQSTRCGLVITDSKTLAGQLGNQVQCLHIQELLALPAPAATPAPVAVHAGSLAYIMFTSGSTGLPKAVMIEQRGIIRLVKDTNYSQFTAADRVLQTGALSFDAATWEIWGPLLHGGAVHIMDLASLLDNSRLQAAMHQYGITKMFVTTAWLNQLADQQPSIFSSLQEIITGGEKISPRHIQRIQQACPRLRIVHAYGPTENTTFSICGEVTATAGRHTIPLGKPISNCTVFILDSNRRPVGVGVPGEIYLGGEGLARGYMMDDERTAQVFVPHPFAPGERLYRTGDLGCWLPGGIIEFTGRADDQVKIRGYRVEPGEVAACLGRHPQVKDAVVIVHQKPGGEKMLVAYYTALPALTREAVRQHLLRQLPAYMVPASLMPMETLPLNANNKVDRKALPEPEITLSTEGYAAPVSATEIQLTGLWRQLLDLPEDALVSAETSFFEMGGHSLKATILSGRIHQQFSVKMPLVEIFRRPTIRGMAAWIDGAGHDFLQPITPAPQRAFYPVSAAQRRLYVLQQFDTAHKAYNIPGRIALEREYSFEELESIFKKLIERHESLRTGFEMRDGEPVQVIHDSVDFSIELFEFADFNETMNHFVRPHNLAKPPLFRVGYSHMEGGQPWLLLDFHHIITDGLSQGILAEDFTAIQEGRELPPVKLQYKDYAWWQHQLLSSISGRQEQFWMERLGGELPVLNLPTDFNRPAVQRFEGEEAYLLLTVEETAFLNRLCREEDVTMYMAILSLWTVLMSKLSGQEDIIVGSPVAGRVHPDTLDIAGMFVNTLPMRNFPQAQKTFRAFLQELKGRTLQAYENQEYPFDEMVEKLWKRRDAGRNPIFDTMFSFLGSQDFKIEVAAPGNEVQFDTRAISAKFDLNFRALDMGNRMYINLCYNTSLFTRTTIKRWIACFRQLLNSLQNSLEQPLQHLEIIDPAEKYQLLITANKTDCRFNTSHQTVNGLFEARVLRQPGSLALADETTSYTYAELNEAANRLAWLLRGRGAGPESIVGLLLPPSAQTVCALLAVFKAGAAYLPIDADLPPARIQHILQHSGVQVLVTAGPVQLPGFSGTVIDLSASPLHGQPAHNLPPANHPRSVAYVIYTSGSTGKPKGVPILHQSLVNYINWFGMVTHFSEKDRAVLTSSFSFDLGHSALYPALALGAALFVPRKETYLQPSALGNYLQQHQITFIKATPTLFSVILNAAGFEPAWLQSLNFLMMGGEAIQPADVQRFFELYPDKFIINHYGPTETTIGVITERINIFNLREFIEQPVIGRPISNVKAYILDAGLNPVPKGCAGQLYISGISLSPGYLHQPDLSAGRFIENPFEPGTKMYATGDLARYNEAGKIIFLGRADHQVKIRGYRVELPEIEKVLQTLPGITEACVLALKDAAGDTALRGFYTAAAPIDAAELRRQLNEILPDYMVPGVVVHLPQMPVTPNGKTDRQALAQYELKAGELAGGEAYVPPGNETESRLQAIWHEVLAQEPVSVTANFFQLGGHSLKALKIITRIASDMQRQLLLKDFFTAPTIRRLAAILQQQATAGYEAIQPAPQQPHYPLSNAQKRLWILHQVDEQQISYNVPALYTLHGKLQIAALEKAFADTLARHEILRTVFRLVNGGPRQFILDMEQMPVAFHVTDLRRRRQPAETAYKLVQEQINTAFKLDTGPLIQMHLYRVSASETVLLLNIHHIISDGWSSGLLHRELFARYEAAVQKQDPGIAPLPVQYKDYACWQQQYLDGGETNRHRSYWLRELGGDRQRLELPGDRPRPAVKTFNGSSYTCLLGQQRLVQQLELLATNHNASLYMLLLAALKALLYRYTGTTDIIIGSAVAGREKAELAGQLGFYVNTLALRTQLHGQLSFEQLLQNVRRQVLDASEHQYYPFDMLVEELGEQAGPGHSPLFDIMFVFQNNDESGAATPALQGLEVKALKEDFKGGKFDISFVARPVSGGLQLYVEYNTDIYEKITIERLAARFQGMLEAVVTAPASPVASLPFLGNEYDTVTRIFNDTAAATPPYSSMQAYFERQAELQPGHTAVIMQNRSLTYAQLNRQANQVAAWLRAGYGTGPDKLVAFMLPRSEWQVICMLGILKAGGAFLPVDPAYPAERIRYILNDAQPALVIAAAPLPDGVNVPVVQLAGLQEDLHRFNGSNPVDFTRPHHLAYVIYTSGSTGKPKGVMALHGGNINMVHDQALLYGMSPADRCLQFASVSFDASVYEIFIAFCSGASLVLVDSETQQNPALLEACIIQHQVSWATLPPVYLSSLRREVMQRLRVIVTAGEAPVTADALYYSRHLAYYNAFGPTEFSVCASVYRVQGHETTVPAGRPLANTQVYILDGNGQPMPVGCWGEMYLAGAGLARGYLNRPELTDEKFVPNPFTPGTRMYKTGDEARWLPDGNIEYRGRLDNMVKIRGNRVELGEIEKTICDYPGVAHALVTFSRGLQGKDLLAAYIVWETAPAVSGLQQWVQQRLPGYMVPGAWVEITDVPLTPNGKVDYKALPQPGSAVSTPDRQLVPPANDTEQALLELWSDVLQTGPLSTTDHFFESGGQSLLAMKLMAAVWRRFEKNMSLRDVMKYPTIQQMALWLQQAGTDQGLLLPLAKPQPGNLPLFLVPPVLGSSTVFSTLAAQLANLGFNPMGLQYRGFDDDVAFDESIYAMAKSCLHEIEQHLGGAQALCLAGYSMGALVAFETTALLEQKGYTVQLVLLDKDPQRVLGEVEARSADRGVLRQIMQAHLQDAGIPDSRSEERIINLLAHNIRLLQAYRVQGVVQAPVLALEAAEGSNLHRMRHWQAHTSGPVQVQAVPGNHFTLLAAEQAPALAASIAGFAGIPQTEGKKQFS